MKKTAMSRMYNLLWLYLSRMDAEDAHEQALAALKLAQSCPPLLYLLEKLCVYRDSILQTSVAGLSFSSPLGLAAGFDKYCEVFAGAVPALGWGFTEIGGITAMEQPGNPRNPPRLRRNTDLRALWNCMGFNNPGCDKASDAIRHELIRFERRLPIGLNVGKSMCVPVNKYEEVLKDYERTIQKLGALVDYVMLNPSSPNTPGLRALQNKEALEILLDGLKSVLLATPHGVKIAPDLSDEEIADIVAVCAGRVHFLAAINTTVSREDCNGWDIPVDKGGVSGALLRDRSREITRELGWALKGSGTALISIGGIDSGHELYTRIRRGASLCQAYSGFVFEGPDFAGRCLGELAECLRSDGFSSVRDAVGCEL